MPLKSKPTGPRTIALVGPYLSGKTTLLESILHAADAIPRKGKVTEGSTFGDASPEARERQMSVEVNVAAVDYLGDAFTFLDCPGSIEFFQESRNALVGADAAVVVCEPDETKAAMLVPIMKALEDAGIPHFIFVNKIDKATGPVRDLLPALQAVSAKPLVLRQIPIRNGGEAITGFVDLALDRAFVYRDDQPSEVVQIPPDAAERRSEARFAMLEKLADFDDRLMEALLEEREPEREAVFEDLAKELQEGLIVPVLLGSADTGHGVRRLLKALRHEAPAHAAAARRLGIDPAGPATAQVLKTYISPHSGKLSLARIWSGRIEDGAILNGERLAGILRPRPGKPEKLAQAGAGETVLLARLEHARTGDTLAVGKEPPAQLPRANAMPPVYELAVEAANRNEEVKLSGAVQKLIDEDPAIRFEQHADTHEFVLAGQGEIHLRVAFDRLKSKHGLTLKARRPHVAYKEAIRRATTQHGRHKRQSGGHGQFGDVHVEIKPLPRGEGFVFENKIVGGVVPKNFIPAVEEGVREYLNHGPLGFPVVDVYVSLYDGQYHAVDSSELAFKTAARIAMTEGLPKCDPVLLEPICRVDIAVPSEHTSKVNQVVSGRRGQILGFDARPGWPGWDVVQANLPQSEMHDLIVELRSLTQGVGTYTWTFDHLQELTGRLAEQVLAQSKAAAS